MTGVGISLYSMGKNKNLKGSLKFAKRISPLMPTSMGEKEASRVTSE